MNSKAGVSRLKVWIRAARIPFLTATAVPITLGSVFAWYSIDSFVWVKFWLTLVAALLIHIGINLANDYFDHLSGCDEQNSTPTPFSGGSRVIQEGLILPKRVLYASLVSFCLGGAIGLYLNYLSQGNVILVLGVIGVFLGFFYTAKPFQIGYGSLGELAVGIGFGPLLILGAYYVQAQGLPLEVFLISLPIGILITLVLLINEFPDHNSDKVVAKRTIVVILGKKKSVVIYSILLASVYLCLTYLVIFKVLPSACFITFLSLPLALRAIKVIWVNFDKIEELLPANILTIQLHLIIGILMTLGLVAAKII